MADRLHVCFVIRSLETGGAERETVELIRRLAGGGDRVTVLVFYGGGQLEQDLAGLRGVTVRSLEKRGRWDMPRFLYRLWSVVRQVRPDVLVGVLGVATESVLLVGRVLGVPVVWRLGAAFMDFSLYDWAPRAIFRIGAWLSRFPDAILINSEAGRAHHVAHGWSPARMEVIPQGFDVGKFQPDRSAGMAVRAEWRVRDEDLLIGLLARLDPIKDHETFLRAAAIAWRKEPALRFACIGGGVDGEYRDRMERLSIELGLQHVLAWVGERRDVMGCCNALDIVTLTSLGEGLSNAIGEAMSCGVPAVVTDVGDMARLVGTTGRVVRSRDADSLAAAWLELAAQPSLRRILGDAARARVMEHYSVDAAARAFRKTFTTLAERRR